MGTQLVSSPHRTGLLLALLPSGKEARLVLGMGGWACGHPSSLPRAAEPGVQTLPNPGTGGPSPTCSSLLPTQSLQSRRQLVPPRGRLRSTLSCGSTWSQDSPGVNPSALARPRPAPASSPTLVRGLWCLCWYACLAVRVSYQFTALLYVCLFHVCTCIHVCWRSTCV